ncbi:hypothetical protein BS78_02G340700 [Paspalum vaginatum]|nr:hypothetical protein BS78_02G340700 [Paspalum vaginatum]
MAAWPRLSASIPQSTESQRQSIQFQSQATDTTAVPAGHHPVQMASRTAMSSLALLPGLLLLLCAVMSSSAARRLEEDAPKEEEADESSHSHRTCPCRSTNCLRSRSPGGAPAAQAGAAAVPRGRPAAEAPDAGG